jgi:1-hydroxycarotenoid 3,4-desaturase
VTERVAIIGAGIGGLSAAMRLAHAGLDVTVLERHGAPGGKMRTVHSLAGPVDAGPTVLTLKPLFAELFEQCGLSLDAAVMLDPVDLLARHRWQDGSCLDLFSDAERSRDAIGAVMGSRAAQQFARFHLRCERLFGAVEGPMLRDRDPSPARMTGLVLRQPWLIPALAPGRSLAQSLTAQFRDPRLRQLFGRYATYVGGYPNASPALLMLIWHAESRGVWRVRGGMHALARAMETAARGLGARFRYGAEASAIEIRGGRAAAVTTAEGERIACDAVLFNGDPAALSRGMLGEGLRDVVPARATAPRSLSAYVWGFAAEARGHELAHHNVYFGRVPNAEFEDIAEGRMPSDPTLYLCAQDHGREAGTQRFQIIMNGPPRAATTPPDEERARCRTITFGMLERMGLSLSPLPEADALTTPEEFHALFPGSEGALYGLSPHGMMQAFRRPRARTDRPGLYLAGGGAHPGAGIPMASLSGRHAVEAIMQDLASTSRPRPAATGGGTSTASPRTAAAPYR